MSSINAHTRLVALLGDPVSHSLSPAMHNAAAAALEENLVYVALPVRADQVAAAVAGLRALHFLGANVTVPHKQAVMAHLDEIDAAAAAVGAVNTIVRRGDQLRGYNTDGAGFLADLADKGVSVAGRRCLVLGAGGSARAVVYALAVAGAAVTVLARRPVQAEALLADLAPHLPAARLAAGDLARLADWAAADLVVNTTPVGMHPNSAASPWPDTIPFPPGATLYDLVYNPADTQLMAGARAAGAAAHNGLGMLLWQGVKAFELWTGRQPDVAVMRAALRPGLA